ncbi:hypothetical protein LEADMMO150B3_02670 [Leclercia adecarboxylata]
MNVKIKIIKIIRTNFARPINSMTNMCRHVIVEPKLRITRTATNNHKQYYKVNKFT